MLRVAAVGQRAAFKPIVMNPMKAPRTRAIMTRVTLEEGVKGGREGGRGVKSNPDRIKGMITTSSANQD